MKIFLPFKIKDIGGTATFAAKFKSGMESYGHQVFFEEPKKYDILFLIVQAPFRYLFDAKKKGKKIVQRLDGTYYWSVVRWKYPLYNLKARIIRYFFADFTIYQSEYSKYCAEKFLGKKQNDPSTLIYNGVDMNLFNPEGEKLNLRDNPKQRIFFTASAFRREDQIVPILHALEIYSKKYDQNFKLLIAGTFSRKAGSIPRKWAHFKNIHFLGKIANKNLPKYERAADVFLFTHLNPPCPNNVIEALACGLPVCGMADGAMPEIITSGSNGELSPVSSDAFWQERKYDSNAFADNIEKILANKERYGAAARLATKNRFSLDRMIIEYIDALDQLIAKNI